MSAPAIGRRPGWAPGPSAKVDWSHPLATGLVVFAVPIEGTRRWRNLVDGETVVQTRRYRDNVPTPTPYGMAATGDLDRQDAGVSFSRSTTGPAVMTMAHVRPFSGGSNYGNAVIVGVGTGTTGAGNIHQAYRTNTALSATYTVSNWGNDNSVSSVDGSDHLMVTTAGPAANVVWIDGRRASTASGTTFTSTIKLHSGHSDYGACGFVALWARQGNDNDAAALWADPFCMLTH